MLCAVGYILKIPGSPIVLCVCVICAERESVFGNSPKYKENSTQFLRKMSSIGLLGDVSPMRQSLPRVGL